MESEKKILLVSSGFYPEISPRSFRATKLAIEFARQRHEVTIYTKYRDFDYTEFLNKNKIRVCMWNKSKYPKIPEFTGKIISLFARILNRILLMLFEYPDIEEMFQVKNALKNEKHYDFLISFAVPFPVHWGVAWSRTKNHLIARIWISDCGDPYMGSMTDSFKKLFYFKYVEKWWCRKTDYISIPVESARSAYYEEFHSKIVVIPQGLRLSDMDIKDEYVKNLVPTFAYSGMFIPGIRDPREFLDHLVTFDQPFKFIIYTKNKSLLHPYQESLKGKLIVYDYIPRKELLRELAQMDFLVNFDNNTSKQIPSKLIDYKLTCRPVLNITADLDKNVVMKFFNGDYSHSHEIGHIGQYDISNVAKKFTSLQ